MQVIIRSAGERTTDECVRRWEDFGFTPIVITLSPFVAALKETYRLGARSKGHWFISCDADVLIDSVPEIPSLKYFHHNVFLRDWFFGRPRCAGLRIYRTDVSAELLKRVVDCVRPEANIVENFPGELSQSDEICGWHDKEQWFRDVYRKAQHHAVKHAKHLSTLKAYWQQQEHPDFEVALTAIKQPLTYNPRDARDFPTWYKEKAPL